MYLCLYVQPLAGVARGQGRAEVLAASQSRGGDRTPQDPPGAGRSAERARSCLSSTRLGGVPWAWDQGRSCGWRAGGGQQCSAARWGAPPRGPGIAPGGKEGADPDTLHSTQRLLHLLRGAGLSGRTREPLWGANSPREPPPVAPACHWPSCCLWGGVRSRRSGAATLGPPWSALDATTDKESLCSFFVRICLLTQVWPGCWAGGQEKGGGGSQQHVEWPSCCQGGWPVGTWGRPWRRRGGSRY